MSSARVRNALSATQASADACNAALQRYINSVERGKKNPVKAVALRIVSQVQKASPVDTGRFRAAWNAGVRKAGGNPTQARRKSVTALGVALGNAEGRAELTDTPDRTEFIAVNGVRYGPFLEAGYSAQAPYGFIRQILDQHADDLLDAVGDIPVDGVK